jgi:signal transduction histidine kinase
MRKFTLWLRRLSAPHRRATRAQLLLVVVAPAAIVAAVGAATLALAHSAAERDARVTRTLELTRTLADLRIRVTDAQTAERGYALTGADRYLAPYRGAAVDAAHDLSVMRILLGADSVGRRRVDTLARLARAEFAVVDHATNIRSQNALGRALTAMEGEDAMTAIRQAVSDLDRDERAHLSALQNAARRQRALVVSAIIVSTGCAVLLALLSNGVLSVLVARRDQAVAALHEANRAKSDFLSTVSHELRTPLNAIGGYAELMVMGLHGPVTDEQREDLRRIRRAGQHLLALITDILSYAKLESGRVEMRVEDIALDEILRGAGAMIEPQARAKGVSYRYIPCDPGSVVHGDRDKVRQIVLNLLSNAVKFTDAGGEVTLGVDPDAAPVRVVVRDTGCGIAPDKLESIFEPFVQVGRRLSTASEGVGLGLAISRALAYAMGGDLTVTSRPGQGSTFMLTLRPV